MQVRNVYIVVASHEDNENNYLLIIDKKLRILPGLSKIYSHSCTRSSIREAYFYSSGDDFFLSFLREITEFGKKCHFHLLIIADKEEQDNQFWIEAGDIVSLIIREVNNWRKRFSICIISALSRDNCILRMGGDFSFVRYYPIKNNLTCEKALELYVGSVESEPIPLNVGITDNREIRGLFPEVDTIPRIVEPPETKVNQTIGYQEFIPSVLYTKDQLNGGENMETKEIIIFSAGAADNYMLNVKSILQDILTSRGMAEYRVVSWRTPGVFPTGKDTLSALIAKGNTMRVKGGFALCLFTPDDPCSIKGEKVFVSRDNVWLEYGLFTGLLGLERVFVLCPSSKEIKKENVVGGTTVETRCWHMPSDFVLQRYEYDYAEDFNTIRSAVTNLLNNMVTEIAKKSPLNSVDPTLSENKSVDYSFSTKI